MKRSMMSVFAVIALTLSACTGTPEQQTAQVAQAIQLGTSTAMTLGLLATPADDATKIATTASKIMKDTVMPLLNGDEAGLVAGLDKLLDLSLFDKPELLKFKLILETAMPLLKSRLPENLVDQQLGKIRPDVKAYLVAFFTGVDNGLDSYLEGKANGSRSMNRHDVLRQKLAK
jgi:hypothetical protein